MKTKKALGPVIAISLLVIVSVVAVIGFQSWYGSYSSKTFTNVETKDKSQDVSIDSIKEGILYIKNTKEENYTLNTIKVGDIDCEIGQNLSLGINSIDLGSCLQNTGTNDIVLVTNNEIIEKKLFVKDYSSCVDITNGIVGLWHMDDSMYSDDFDGTEIDLNKWNNLGDVSINSNRLKLTTDSAIWSESSVNTNNKMFFDGDFDIQIDHDSSTWIGYPGTSNWNNELNFVNNDLYKCYTGRLPASKFYSSWNSETSLDFNLAGNPVGIDIGKLRITRTGNVFKCYYWNSGWVEYASRTSNNILGRGYIEIRTKNKAAGGILTTYFDNLIVNKGELIEDSTLSNNGSLIGGSISYGKLNNAIEFDGVDDYVDLSLVPLDYGTGTPSGFSFGSWIYINKISTTKQGRIFNQISSSSGEQSLSIFLQHTDSKLHYDVWPPSFGSLMTTSELNTNEWYHIFVTNNGTTRSIYINGILNNSDSNLETYTGANIDKARIGALGPPDVNIHPFNGTIDDVAIYNRSLSAQEIQEIYQAGLAKKPICNP